MKKVKRLAVRLLILAAALGLVWYFSTFTLRVTNVEIESDKIESPIKILQISDLHGALFGRENRRLIKKIDSLSPDMIIATGDMYTAGDEVGRQRAAALLGSLAQDFSTYYVTGEHDNSKDFHGELEASGVQVLDYEVKELDIGGNPITLYGISNVYYSPTFDLYNEFTPDRERFNILAAHICNPAAFADFSADLTLCGDTHGGQVRLPYLGAVYLDGEWFPERRGALIKGLYSLGEGQLFVSSGLGNRPYPIRLFNRPEIALITLK